MVAALDLNALAANANVELKLTGALLSGAPFTASDCVRLGR
jgi:hypothetical protein